MNRPEAPTTFVPMTPTMRQLIENVVEDLLLLLDEIDGDADLEDNGDLEPSIGGDDREWDDADNG